MIWWILAAVFVLSVVYLLSLERRGKHLPPGVRGLRALPVFVRMLRMKLDFHIDIRKQYGDVASLQLPGRKLIFIGNHQLLKEAYSKAELADRPTADHGLISSNGRLWKEQRRFALTTLRDFGMGKSVQEERILNECVDLVKEFRKHENAFDPKFYIGCAVTNVICATIFSDRFHYGDPILNNFLDLVTENVSTPYRMITAMLPIVRLLPKIRADMERTQRNRETIASIVRGYVDDHQKTYQEGNVRDYIDAYLEVMKREGGREDSTFTELQLIRSVHDLFVAGSETTGTTLRWALAIMALNPEVQEKVYEEIMNVVGNERTPSMSDRQAMTYTEAVLLEIQRYGTIVPVIAHKANASTTIAGYQIDEGSRVICSIYALNRDPRVWPYPEEFNVGNFLKDGEIINRNYFVAFSTGKRSCLGESLAKTETFLFFVTFLQKFRFFFGAGEEPDLTKPNRGVIRTPKPYRIRIKARD